MDNRLILRIAAVDRGAAIRCGDRPDRAGIRSTNAPDCACPAQTQRCHHSPATRDIASSHDFVLYR